MISAGSADESEHIIIVPKKKTHIKIIYMRLLLLVIYFTGSDAQFLPISIQFRLIAVNIVIRQDLFPNRFVSFIVMD